MAELGAGANVMAVVSLGLHICGGVVKYYSACKGYDKDVAAFVDRAEGLSNIIELLQHTLSSWLCVQLS